ncbi:Fanconi anemia group I protein isoform X2 [Ceratina calcarata]|uniref:Fanconi anemia group I protein isoform X2 n=1 Tax=Ceratina calcarata TaxID=156304 RepID=A0AAJ7SB76_9HYME|nr:Fanconi anemia group I protein isoform X2 [Ceratina calcarata]
MYRNKTISSLTNAEDCENPSQQSLRVQNSNEEFEELIRKNICKPEITKVLDKIFETFSDSDACQLKRRKLVESTLKELAKVNVPSGQANTIVNRIISDIPRYSKQHLVKLVEFCVANIRNDDDPIHSWKDLLPVLLETLENEKYVTLSHGEVSGKEYKEIIVKDICNSRWDVNILPPLTKMFGDVALDKTHRSMVLKSLCSALPRLPLDQVPSFVYQALKLCKDKDNQKLLSALSKYFENCYLKTVVISSDEQDFEEIGGYSYLCNVSFDSAFRILMYTFTLVGTISLKEVQENESTVLYHVYQAARLNHENMRDFIRFIKQVSYAPEYMLQPFMLAVLMTVSSIYEDQIYETLRTGIVNDSLEKSKRECSAWLRQLLPPPRNIIEIIRRVIESSNKDRHLILKGLTDLAFTLMKVEQKSKNNATVMWHIGSDIIQEIIKKRHETVPAVLQELINKIVSGGTSTTHYTGCLKYACRELSMIVLDHQALIMTILERLLFLPSTVASQVLNAMSPLMHVSANIRENILLILRKALYRKGVSKRQMAVTGFLEMLKYSKMYSRDNYRLSQHSNSSFPSNSRSMLTQATLESNSQGERFTPQFDKSLCYEILDILKKCFTFEFEVRLHLYEGLYDAITKNPGIIEILIDMFLSHLNLYVETDDSILPPVKFDLCIEIHGTEVVLQEPIGQLIFALQKICVNSTARYSNVFEKLRDTLELLCKGMAATQLEHLNLDNGIDYLHEDFPKPQRKLKTLDASFAVYEALMAYRIVEWSKGNTDGSQITDLFKGYTRLTDFIRAQSTKAKKADGKSKKDKETNNTTIKKPIKSNDIKIPTTIMDLTVIRDCLSLLFSQSSTQDDNVLRKNQDFCCYILRTCEQLLQHSRPFINDSLHTKSKQCINTYIDIGRLLYQNFLLCLNDAFSKNERAAVLALQCFKEISCWMCTSISSELPAFLNSILGTRSRVSQKSSSNVDSQLEEIILSLKPHLKAALVEDAESEEKKKVALILLEIMKQFSYKINFEKHTSDKILEGMRKMLEEEDIQTSNVPAIVQFFLELEEYAREYGATFNDICLELCKKVGTIDGVTELETNREYKIVRDDTVLPIYNTLNNHIKEKLNNSSCLFMRLKAEDNVARTMIDGEEGMDNLKEKERHLCKHLSYLAQVLHTLANTAMKSISCTDATFKNLHSLYHLLVYLTKYFCVKSSNQNAAFQAVKFIQTVQLAGKPLKSAFYNLVAYVEENQNESNSKTDSYAQRNKILKETKVIPRVVYEIEQFNKEILLLGKRTDIPLENYIKHSVTRDFRIKNVELVEALERLDASLLTGTSTHDPSETSTSHINEADSDSEDTTSPKRTRMED